MFFENFVCLPQQDHYIVNRQNNLENRQREYNFTVNNTVFGYPEVIPGLPPSFKLMAPTYMLPKEEQLTQTSMAPHGIALLSTNFQSIINKFVSMKNKISLHSVEQYLKLIVLPNYPQIIQNQTQDQLNTFNWLSDEEFGRQRIQGINSGKLELLNSLTMANRNIPEKLNFTVNKTILNQVLSEAIDTNFDDALQRQLLYVIDYEIFEDQEYIDAALSFDRYVSSPLALFYVNPETGKLYPLCIKILQNDAESPVFSPKSTYYEWVFAKLWFQSADGQYMEFITHLFECHLLGEVFAIATHRQLSESHPIFQLLHPHFNLLLDINWRARGDLLGKNGPIDTLLGPGSVGALKFIAKFNKTYKWSENTFVERMKRNNIPSDLKESTTVKNYFFREDGLTVYNQVHQFVSNVLNVFYKHPEDIERDFELQAWFNELHSSWGGQMQSLTQSGKLETLEEVIQLITDIIFRVSVEHSIGNHGQWDMYGFTPNVPGALYLDPRKVKSGIVISQETVIDALPPKHETVSQISITHLLSNTDTGLPTLIATPYKFEKDPQLSKYVYKLRSSLEDISDKIQLRNQFVKIPYSYIDPSKVCSSIFI
ncbi:putative arachidonate 12-lipoxygenase [Heterostelium album PN500]|uniref:Putative arachidonate 12-lipoxygenase n=1 Tax=Heterostelium pallidum (strain ATCC 26659 / Pp 5 / PN500) TaxID=670386 RepID=D3BBM6_HETP5|nr:putative arachidonate 12-lipoxygenase [Heterostelium album PN500]EFA81059.1 putative arachidonate 12-lipoxygenase [Heterostelium album PN500]|eukprot:XP_020433177.1 putative arachidonate 12-lipoxygenase [Heterostelium album PN500]